MDPLTDLSHAGILGMKWGKRRAKTSGPDTSSDDSKLKKALMKKKINELSDAELTRLTKRLNLEKEYSRLNPSAQEGAKRMLEGIFNSIVKPHLQTAASAKVKSLLSPATP